MSFQAKRELLVQVAPRYHHATHAQKSLILDEFIAATGYARKYAIRLLTQPVSPPAPSRRPRQRTYGPAVQDALLTAWAAANFICAKRLVPFLPELVPSLERHGHLYITDEVRAQLFSISPATADRILRAHRQAERPQGVSTTKAGSFLKHQVPVRTFTEWNDVRPGFVEADLVAHCGTSPEGSFLYTLVLTDVATGWTECLALPYRSQHVVVQALERAQQLLPFPLLGLDTDNGGEFLEGSKVSRTYDSAQTPLQRLVTSDVLTPDRRDQLGHLAHSLDPVRLLEQIRTLQDALWQHAVLPASPRLLSPLDGDLPEMRFRVKMCLASEDADLVDSSPAPEPGPVEQMWPSHPDVVKRAYRRSTPQQEPRWWRTRLDPFAEVWDEICAWLIERPERTAKSVLQELQQRYPGQYGDEFLRTLQRRVRTWRAGAILIFDDAWLEEDVRAGHAFPRPLRAAGDGERWRETSDVAVA